MSSLDIVIPCYNCSNSVTRVLKSISIQIFSSEVDMTVYLVNDASTEHFDFITIESQYSFLKVINLELNHGRAYARNTGANYGDSKLILFLDSDCELKNKECLDHLIKNHSQSNGVSFGSVRSIGRDFWSNYFNLISEKREKNTAKGKPDSLTSAFFIIRRDLFKKSGGFNEKYKNYGFEDRELFFNLTDAGAIFSLEEKSIAYHDSVENIFSVTEKLYESGMYSSKIFEQSFPDIYRNTIYGKIDARIHPLTIKPLVILFSPFKSLILNLCNQIIICRPIPFFFKAITVKFASAFAYSIGTNSNTR